MSDTISPMPYATEGSVSGGFIYENEHPQLQIPFTARVGAHRLEGKTLSITEAYVSGLMPQNVNLARSTMALQFDFEGFTLNLFVIADIEKIGDSSIPDHKMRFCDPTASHLAPLRHIMNSHLAGDLITLDRLLGYTGLTRAKSKTPTVLPTAMQRISRAVRKLGIFALSISLIAIATNIVHDRFVFSYEPRPIVISQSGETLRATTAGQITYTNDSAGLGDVVYSIGANSGDLLSVRMPCDCDIQPLSEFYEGATILAGTPLVKLVDADAVPEVSLALTFEGATRLILGDMAELEMANGTVVPVSVAFPETLDVGQVTDLVAAKLSFDFANIDQITVGESARLRFRRSFLSDAISTPINTAFAGVKRLFLGS